MTHFPTLIDQVATAVLAPAPVTENPHHRAILDVFVEIQDLDRQLAVLSGEERPDGVSATEQLETLTDVLIERMAAGAELSALLSTSCCCVAAYEPAPEADYEPVDDQEPDFEPDFEDYEPDFEELAPEEDFLSCPSSPKTIVHACLDVFDTLTAQEYAGTADLVTHLRTLPGEAEGRWRYADLTPIRLALLLRPYGVQPRKPRAADGSRYRAYRREDLLAARPNCPC
ncbi:DUF3631 domain-containing protein [Streptomyces violascens]|uniref:DUF3631 domain-containing protein n=1 Tax=Streptomyces violascens TaxID=67381 RepID=UPI0036BB54DF